METWDERERLRSLVDTAARALRLAQKLVQQEGRPNPRTSKAFRDVAGRVAGEIERARRESLTVDAWRLEDLSRDAARAKKVALAAEQAERPHLEPFMTLLEDVRAARRQSESFYRSARRPSEAKLAKSRAELLEYLKEMDTEYGPVPEDVKRSVRKTWERLERELFR